jgi:hypothetical protein
LFANGTTLFIPFANDIDESGLGELSESQVSILRPQPGGVKIRAPPGRTSPAAFQELRRQLSFPAGELWVVLPAPAGKVFGGVAGGSFSFSANR